MAAGLGFKTFNTGDVLSAADTNGYLMQGVLVFANATARDAAITSPQEGQFAFTKDNDSLWYYSGSAWVSSGATGDIEGVTAGVGISGGGTSGTVTVTNSMATAIDAKGDLIAGTGADTFARLAVGTNGHTLVADSAEATGLKWAAPAGGGSGLTLIQRSTFSDVANTGTTFDGVFTSTYATYLLTFDQFYASTSGDDFQFQFRYAGPTTQATDYSGNSYFADADGTSLNFAGYGAASQAIISAISGNSTYQTNAAMFVQNVGNASAKPRFYGNGGFSGAFMSFGGSNDIARTYTGFLLKSSSSNITGIVAVYGLAKS